MGNAVDIVVSGGSMDGMCDATGFLKAITEDLGLSITSAAGASAGGVVLGIYAAGHSASEIEQLVINANFSEWIAIPSWWNIVRIYRALRCGWLSNGSNLDEYFNKITFGKTLRQSRIDLHLAGTDFCRSEIYDFNKTSDSEMPLALAMRITCCVPGCFKLPFYSGTYWADGSIRSHYPAEMIPQSERPFFGFLSTLRQNSIMKNFEGIYGTISRIIDSTIDINIRYSAAIAKRQPITIQRSDTLRHNWDISKEERIRLIEDARVATINRVSAIVR
jgi:predicted acylesterase/phospholipase RssA